MKDKQCQSSDKPPYDHERPHKDRDLDVQWFFFFTHVTCNLKIYIYMGPQTEMKNLFSEIICHGNWLFEGIKQVHVFSLNYVMEVYKSDI